VDPSSTLRVITSGAARRHPSGRRHCREVLRELILLLLDAQDPELPRVEQHEALHGERAKPVGVPSQVRLPLGGMGREERAARASSVERAAGAVAQPTSSRSPSIRMPEAMLPEPT